MHNNLNTLKMKQVLELQPFIPNANRLNIYVKVSYIPSAQSSCRSSMRKELYADL